MVEDINTVPILIFLADIPNKVIKIKAPYTNGIKSWSPKNKSDINRLIKGIKKMIQRFVNPLLDRRAIAVIGVKFGG